MNSKPHLTQNEKLDRLLSDHEGEWVPLPDVMALGIAAYSRRFEDLRKLYGPQGYAIENKMERGSDGVTRSWYRKVRAGYPQAEKPETQFSKAEPRKGNARKLAVFSLPLPPMKSWEQIAAERKARLSATEQEPEWKLVP